MLKNKLRSAIAVLLSSFLLVSLAACSSTLDESQKKQIAAFYVSYIEQATSLNNADIEKAYSELSTQNFTGQQTDAVRDVIFKRFSEIKPEFFDQLAVKYASYDDVGTTYSSILLMSLATGGQAIKADMPLDAITVTHDDKLNITVYEIDRAKITAPLPLVAKNLVTKVDKDNLPPVRIIKDGLNWKVIPDSASLNEIGIPNKG